MLNKIKEFFKRFTFKDWLLLLMAAFVLLFYIQQRYWHNKSTEYFNQRGIYADSITAYKNKLGEEYASKQTMIMNEKDLKKYNQDLWNELKSLKDNPLVLTKTNMVTEIKEIQGKNDTVYVEVTPAHHSEPNNPSSPIIPEQKNYVYEWSSKDSIWYDMKGKSTVSSDFKKFNTVIPEFKMNSVLTLDVVETKENLRVIAKTNNPYINISDIQSVVIDPRKSKTLKSYFPQKRWGIGPQVGIGLTGDLKFRPYIGIGIQYSIFNF